MDARNSDRTGDAGADVCPQTASFSESFDDRITAERNWHIETTAGCSAGFSGGSASVVASGSAASECTFTSTSCFDLTSSDIVFEIDPITDHLPQLRAFIRARAANGNTLEIAFQEDHFLHGLTINQVQIPYDDQALYWRMRGGGNGYVYFHSSTDGVAWDLLGYYQLSWAVDQVHVIFGVSTSAPMARSIGVGTASYNLLP